MYLKSEAFQQNATVVYRLVETVSRCQVSCLPQQKITDKGLPNIELQQ